MWVELIASSRNKVCVTAVQCDIICNYYTYEYNRIQHYMVYEET
jgi:hypothetical protein